MHRSARPIAARVAMVCATILTLSFTAATTDAAPGAQPVSRHLSRAEAPTSMLGVVTYNAGAKVSPEKNLADLTAVLENAPDIVALQEMSSGVKRRLVREQFVDCEGCLWDAYMPTPATPGGTPVLYRSDRFRLVATGTQQVTEPTYVGKAGAGPSTIRAKYVNWLRLRDLTSGRLIHVLNNHAVPSVQGKGGGPNTRFPARLKIYKKHMTGLQDMVRDITTQFRWSLVFVTGDLNVNYRRDRVIAPTMFPFHRLGEVGLLASYEALGEPKLGTHTLSSGNDKRLIDHVYFLPRRALVPYSQQILTGLSSDHRPLLVRFELADLRVAATPGVKS